VLGSGTTSIHSGSSFAEHWKPIGASRRDGRGGFNDGARVHGSRAGRTGGSAQPQPTRGRLGRTGSRFQWNVDLGFQLATLRRREPERLRSEEPSRFIGITRPTADAGWAGWEDISSVSSARGGLWCPHSTCTSRGPQSRPGFRSAERAADHQPMARRLARDLRHAPGLTKFKASEVLVLSEAAVRREPIRPAGPAAERHAAQQLRSRSRQALLRRSSTLVSLRWADPPRPLLNTPASVFIHLKSGTRITRPTRCSITKAHCPGRWPRLNALGTRRPQAYDGPRLPRSGCRGQTVFGAL
jgi:hypothetical protein